ncbi:DUF6440 family protein [Irregularibacter muris]|uniref:DUF6440 family protein n=1 Tax=Irregularibacter muris TaxID=1796619 RepID=A0AAE3HEB7_9FIRM|nr:DUF6440 family protein [Irregularibacter muris]MCR1897920.1 DUF6440 family protein [Irregularibacter muris]
MNYLFTWDRYGGGMVILLSKDGKPVIIPLNVDQYEITI